MDIKKRSHGALALCLLALGLSILASCKKQEPMESTSMTKIHYHCAMHPQVVSDKPGDCPICHMKLVPVGTASSVALSSSDVQGQSTVHLGPGVEERIGVQIAEVQWRELETPIRAAARVAYDPQLYSAALEHREAVKFLNQVRSSGGSEVEQAEATVNSSELRLRQMGLSDDQIAEISKPGYDPSSLLIGSKDGRVWVYADVFDNQIGSVKTGQRVELTSPALPGKIVHGTVRGIDPAVNPETRTVRVRISATNTSDELRPGIYLGAEIKAGQGRALTVPENAVVDTGTRQLVYVQTAASEYTPRVVHVGRQAEGVDEILDGLQAGEKVATSANFLLDSESKIEATAQEAVHP